ncbi:hypothetical protein RMATCC62417_05756 [Rhizopus microsporus]|nr:hypothetical protein RMATCC62417_05756 [Rhizopus microsporus]
MTHRPVNTIKAYSAKQEEWKKWCFEQRFGDGEIVTDEKLSYSLAEYVMKRGRKLRRNADGTPIALGRESVLAYVKAIADMYSKQKTLGLNPMALQEGPSLGLFWILSKKKRSRLEKVSDYFLTEKNDHLDRRDRFCFLISHAMLCRSQTAVGMQFADLFSLVLENQGVSECIALVAAITFGKTNQHGKIEYDSSVRHRDVENEPFPDFIRRENWYETVVFKENDRFTSITYRAQHKIYVDAFKRVGIHTSKLIHANRKSALNMIAQENVSSDQQKMVGRWGTDRMVGCYISSLPVEAMKSLAGFPPHQGSYFLPRAVVISPKDLQVLIFPDIEFWKEKFDNDDRVQEDIAGPNFLGLLAQLRVVFLQDSVILKKRCPNYYLWTFELFSNSLYKVFEDQLLASLQEGDAAFTPSQRVTMAIPELVSSLHSRFSSITSTMLGIQTSNASQMQQLNQRCKASLL